MLMRRSFYIVMVHKKVVHNIQEKAPIFPDFQLQCAALQVLDCLKSSLLLESRFNRVTEPLYINFQ